MSIFIPGLDPVGSSDQRRELLERSIIVTLRNPWGIGIGNFPIVGVHNLVTHNAFTQVSSEIGLLGLAAYLIFMISPLRKLGAIERTLSADDDHDWFYYLAIGLQASIVGYMVYSFFVAVAYNWFIYYLIAYAVAFRRIYKIERGMV
jgi:O-antigen ligase